MSGAIPTLPLRAFMAWTGKILPLPLPIPRHDNFSSVFIRNEGKVRTNMDEDIIKNWTALWVNLGLGIA
jgi:hypothetical protein